MGVKKALPKDVLDALAAQPGPIPVTKYKCLGKSGTLIRWADTEGRAELCKEGTPALRGIGYSSYQCRDYYTEENTLQCCKVQGKLHCVPGFYDNTSGPLCRCGPFKGPPRPVVSGVIALCQPRWNASI